jgi:adenine-specific DNA-methyltransferase
MKYMGHKGKLLPVLDQIIDSQSANSKRIADPFCGSGIVSWSLARRTKKIIVSGDLQSFAVARAAAVVERTSAIDAEKTVAQWFGKAEDILEKVLHLFPNAGRSIQPDECSHTEIRAAVERSRNFCEEILPPLLKKIGGNFPMSIAYGGHYFSPLQALQLDSLRQSVPASIDARKVCIAALIETASRCAASPGHTAQPFQPTITAARYIAEAWSRSVWMLARQAVQSIAETQANVKGCAKVGDFKEIISLLEPGDLVFADPPYSDVHYSRFYHVLETLARGESVLVSGIGRYPDIKDRPSSYFSRKGMALFAAQELVHACASKEVNLILTFPSNKASNGLKAEDFIRFGSGKFTSISTEVVDSTFSTLGGSPINRGGRQICSESIVTFSV